MDVLYATETGYTVPDATTRLGDDTAPACESGSPAKVHSASEVGPLTFEQRALVRALRGNVFSGITDDELAELTIKTAWGLR